MVQSTCRDCCRAGADCASSSGNAGSTTGGGGARSFIRTVALHSRLSELVLRVGHALSLAETAVGGSIDSVIATATPTAAPDARTKALVPPDLWPVVMGYSKGVTVTIPSSQSGSGGSGGNVGGRPSALKLSQKTAVLIALELQADAGAAI